MVLKSQIPNEQKAQVQLKHDYDHEQVVDARNKRVRTRELVRAHANTAPLEKLPAELLRDILVYSQNTGLVVCSKPLCAKLYYTVGLAYRYIVGASHAGRLLHNNRPILSSDNITELSGCAGFISKPYCTIDLLKLIDKRHSNWPRCARDKIVGIPKKLLEEATEEDYKSLKYMIENGWINGWPDDRTTGRLLCCGRAWQADPDSLNTFDAIEELIKQGGAVQYKMLKYLVGVYEKRLQLILMPWFEKRVNQTTADAVIERDDIDMYQFLNKRYFYVILPVQDPVHQFSLALKSGSLQIAEALFGNYRIPKGIRIHRKMNKLRELAAKKNKIEKKKNKKEILGLPM